MDTPLKSPWRITMHLVILCVNVLCFSACDQSWQEDGSPLPRLDPEVIQVCTPPFVPKASVTEPAVGNFSRTPLRHSFIKMNTDRPVINTGNPKDEITEDVSVPKDLDLVALPHFCFPGETKFCAKA